ncbi:MAG: hypothetical protein H7174_04540 [Flavobacterium sp.]|nr:hypothetical protein [Flavobacterium sp.]
MKHNLLIVFIFLLHINCYSQLLKTNSYGSVLNEDKTIVKPEDVKKLLANYPTQLNEYSLAIKKRNLGNIFIYSGVGLIFTDLLISLTKDLDFPKALSAVGFGAISVGVPIKLGYSKKIQNAINGYNSKKELGYNQKLEIIGNPSGLGIKLSFN